MKKTLLFTIIMALLCLASPMSAQVTPNQNGELQFTYPSAANVLVWTGNGSDNNWSTTANWMFGDRTPVSTLANMANCDVFIPNMPNGKYPTLNAKATCNRIYLASEAMLGNQFNLTATYGWYTDIVIPTNCWVFLSSPLADTYTGDFFTATQGGTYTGPWDGAHYNGINGNVGPNRLFPSSIYQRLFSSYVTIEYEPYTCRYFETSWSQPTNALSRKYQTAEGFQVYAKDVNGKIKADFHFPSAESTYYFYTTSGNQSTVSATVSHANSNQPAYNNSEIRPIVNRETTGAADVPPMFAVGNPSFAKLNIAEFLKENAIGGNTTPYLYKHNESTSKASETIYYYNLTNSQLYVIAPNASNITDHTMPSTQGATVSGDAFIERNRGFRVMAGKAEVKCIEPDLLGVYDCNLTAGTVEYNGGTNNTLYPETNPSTMTIATGDTPNEVIISNFAGWGLVKGIINTANHTITISGGQNASMVRGRRLAGSSGWSCDNTNQPLSLMGCYEDSFNYSTNNYNLGWGRNTKYVTNVNKSTPVILSYEISSDGTVSFNSENKFAIYPSNGNQYYLMTDLIVGGNDLKYMTSWICFESYSGEKTQTTGTSQFINPNFFGTFQYTISNRYSDWNEDNNATNIQFTISPIAGKYDIVEIKGLYPNNSTDIVNGKIERNSDNTYKLTIPAGQRIKNTTNITTDYFIYDLSKEDVVINLNAAGTQFSLAKRMMVTLINCQAINSWLLDWSAAPGFRTTTTITKTAQWDGQTTDPTQIQIGTNKNSISLYFNANMFSVDPATTTTQAPRRAAAQGSTVATITANHDDNSINTMILRGVNAYNGFLASEDAALVDNDDEDFSISTLAGTTRVAVNAINDTTRAQIVLTGVNGDVELVFDNLEALGENVRLFDANDSTERPLNGSHDNVTVNFGVNDSPLRYSLVWDYAPIISGNETLVDLDFTVFSPAKGEVKVMSGDMMNNVRLYNAAGQLVKSIAANNNDASFSALLPGIYVVEIYTNNGRGTKKVDVK